MNPWVLKASQPEGMKVCLVTFTYAGGGGSVFRGWHDALAPEVGVLSLQLPGRENRLAEEPLHSYTDILPHICSIIDGITAPRLAFFGHSAGAHLAYATAQRLRSEGKRVPDHLLISARRPLNLPQDPPLLTGLDDQTLTQTLMQRSGQSALVAPELFEMMLPTMRADIEASESWQLESDDPIEARLSLLNGADDYWTDTDEILGWKDLVRGETNQRTFSGDHFFITTQEEQVLAFVKSELLY